MTGVRFMGPQDVGTLTHKGMMMAIEKRDAVVGVHGDLQRISARGKEEDGCPVAAETTGKAASSTDGRHGMRLVTRIGRTAMLGNERGETDVGTEDTQSPVGAAEAEAEVGEYRTAIETTMEAGARVGGTQTLMTSIGAGTAVMKKGTRMAMQSAQLPTGMRNAEA